MSKLGVASLLIDAPPLAAGLPLSSLESIISSEDSVVSSDEVEEAEPIL